MIKDRGDDFDTALSKRLSKMMELAMDLEYYWHPDLLGYKSNVIYNFYTPGTQISN